MTNSTDPDLQRLQGAAEAEEILHFPPDFAGAAPPPRIRWKAATPTTTGMPGKSPATSMAARPAGKACDWWNNAEADLKTASAMGQNTHRMSVEWSRIEPREGVWDDEAIDRYRAILQCMIDHGLEPMVTLHHFTTPLWLTHRGGWENPAIDPLLRTLCGKDGASPRRILQSVDHPQ